MMRTLRDKKTMQVVLWTLVFVFVAFIFFSWGAKFTSGNRKDPNLLAKIGDAQITYSDFNKVYQPALDKLYNAKNESPNSNEIQRLKGEVLDNLIDQAVLQQAAQKLGVNVPDEELMASIQRQPYFLNETGKFDKAKYYQILQANQLTSEQFETSERNQLLMQKIQSIFTDGVLYTKDELNNYIVFLNRDLKANFIEINPADFEKNTKFTESDLKDYYEKNKSSYDRSERAKVRHILIGNQTNDKDTQTIEKTLEDYRRQILTEKAKFQDLAKKYSQDGGSKDKGGELGWITKGTTVKEFENAVFQLKPGEITKPFKTQFGYHIAQLEDYEKAYKSTFTEVRSKLLKQYTKEKTAQKTFTISEQLVDKLKQNTNLEKSSQELGLKVKTTPWFNRTAIPGLKKSANIANELASLYVKEWKGPLSLNQNEYFFQIIDSKEGKASSKNLEDARSEAAQQLLSYRQESWLKDFLKDERKKLDVKVFSDS